MKSLAEKFSSLKNFLLLREKMGRGRRAKAGGLYGSAGTVFLLATSLRSKGPLLVITPHLDEAEQIFQEVRSVLPEGVLAFPAWESLPGEESRPDPEIFSERLQTVWRLGQGERGGTSMVVAAIQSLLQPLPSPTMIENNLLELAAGSESEMRRIIEWAEKNELERADIVSVPGQFGVRGGIVDLFPPSIDLPVRLDFFGDRLESIRTFDPATQRSLENLEKCRLFSVRASDFFSPRPTGEGFTLLDYLPEDAAVAYVKSGQIAKKVEQLDEMFDDLVHARAYRRLQAACERLCVIETAPLPFADAESVNFPVRSLQRFEGKLEQVRDDFARILEKGREVVVFVLNEAERTRFTELFEDELAVAGDKVRLTSGTLFDGFELRGEGLFAVAYHQLFNRYRQTRVSRKYTRAVPVSDFLELQKNDYVVHLVHGIGRFLGVEKMERDGLASEYLCIEYADSARIYEPVLNIELVQKYIGVKGFVPRLDRLGTGYWSARKARVKRAVKTMAAELLRIQAIRNAKQGIAYPADDRWQHEFEEAFIYEATLDQLEVAELVKQDMQKPRPTDRLICGDVGYGKTEIAMRAAFKAVLSGRQVAVLVPTTVLAQQHYKTFSERMADFPVIIDVISRFKTPGEQRETLKRAAKGRTDILIGTHRLLSDDVEFKNLGLLIIDEEQRFGVEHKERLKRLRAIVDILTLTATPIPRTLHMALLGLRDISSLTTPPKDRLAINTTICRYEPKLIREAILRELNRDGQVFFVHNRVFDIERVADRIQTIVPEAAVGIAHGQMSEHLLEKRMIDFVEKKFDVLVCTTIIESGLDIPNVNTIFIDDARTYGLADLHQLRGRVGRYKHRAYAYLLVLPHLPLSEMAEKRLRAIEEFNELGSGFKIAMRDLEIRGAGNILGPEQHGHITAVGYDLFCRLLKASVDELKNIEIEEPIPVTIQLGLKAEIPESYIPAREQRLRVYRRISAARSRDVLDDLREELRDRYGPLPEPVKTLIEEGELRFAAARAGITKIALQDRSITMQVVSHKRAAPKLRPLGKKVRLVDPKNIRISLSSSQSTPETALALLKKWLQT